MLVPKTKTHHARPQSRRLSSARKAGLVRAGEGGGVWHAAAIKEDSPHPACKKGTAHGCGGSGHRRGRKTRKTLPACAQQNGEQPLDSARRLKEHRYGSRGHKPYACPYESCGKHYAHPVSLTAHVRSHTGEKCLICPWESCARRFFVKSRLKTHMGTHSGERRFACPYENCGKRFTRAGVRTLHLRLHTGEKPFVCCWPGCGKKFSQSGGLVVHRRFHTREKPFACLYEGCHKTYFNLESLASHMYCHTGEKRCICPYEGCAKRFVQPKSLAMHKRRHTGEKCHVCPYENCGKKLVNKLELTRHLRTHTGERPFVCPQEGCARRFVRASNMIAHRRIHTRARENRFVCPCDNCPERFGQSGNQTAHRHLHKSFRCVCGLDGCGTVLRQTTDWYRHPHRPHSNKTSASACAGPGGDSMVAPGSRLQGSVHTRSGEVSQPFALGTRAGGDGRCGQARRASQQGRPFDERTGAGEPYQMSAGPWLAPDALLPALSVSWEELQCLAQARLAGDGVMSQALLPLNEEERLLLLRPWHSAGAVPEDLVPAPSAEEADAFFRDLLLDGTRRENFVR